MSGGRAYLSLNSIFLTFNSLAIALRFVCQRRQFGTDTKEQLLIDYPSMRYRLIPLIAQAYVYAFGGIKLVHSYDFNISELLKSDSKIIEQLHGQSGVCKAKSTWFGIKAMTECRQCCGGHVYSSLSGFSRLYHAQDVNTSWEGDNNMLLQQTTKYILKEAGKVSKGIASPLSFLKNEFSQPKPSNQQLMNLEYLENLFKWHIKNLVTNLITFNHKNKKAGMPADEIWNQSQAHYGNSLSLAYGDLFYLLTIRQTMREKKIPQQMQQITQKCTIIWALSVCLENKIGNVEMRKMIEQIIPQLVDWITPRSISLIDCFVPPSSAIGSVFAQENGEGMKNYVTKLFSAPKTFNKVEWSDKLIQLRDSSN